MGVGDGGCCQAEASLGICDAWVNGVRTYAFTPGLQVTHYLRESAVSSPVCRFSCV